MKKLCIRIWLLMLCLCSRNVYAEEGTCGTNVKYTTSNDTVTFSKADPASEAVWGNCGDVFQYAPKYRVIKVSDTLRVESGGGLFYDFPYVRKMYLSDLDVSDVTNMNGMFAGCSSLTDLDVSGWDTSGVISMHSMFSDCSSLTSLDVSSWDTSNVIDMNVMFYGCGSLTSLDLSKWDTSNVIEMVSMFNGCRSLTDLDVSGWDTSGVTDMMWMFYGCRSLTNLDVSGWDTSDVTNMFSMFEDCRSLTALDLSNWDTSNVNDTYEWEGMFLGCNSLSVITLGKDSMSGANIFFSLPKAYNTWVYTAQGEIASDPLPLNTAKSDASLFEEYDHRTMAGTWSVSENAGAAAGNQSAGEGTCGVNVKYTVSGDTVTFSKADPASEAVWEDCGSVFQNDPKYRTVKVSDTIRIKDGRDLFYCFPYVREMYLANFDVSGVTNMSGMFAGCSSLTTLDVSSWDTSAVTNMTSMFDGCHSLTDPDVSCWDTSNVTRMSGMFNNCASLTDPDVSRWDTSAVTSMSGMFNNCISLTGPDVNGWDISSVTDMYSMFQGCVSLTGLNISGWDTSAVTGMSAMFKGCNSLSDITLGKNTMAGGNIFNDLPKAYDTWVYTAQGETVSDPLPLNTAKSDASLFEEYDHRTMAGTWSVGEGTCGTNVKYTTLGNTVTFSKADPASESVWEDCDAVFRDDPKYRTVKVSDTIRVENGRNLFYNTPYVQEMYLTNFDVSDVTDMCGMFAGCSSLTILDVSNWDTSNVIDMNSMFARCGSLTSLDVTGWDTSGVTNMTAMFKDCSSLKSLNLSGWDTSNVKDIHQMFSGCNSLSVVTLGKNTMAGGNIRISFEQSMLIEPTATPEVVEYLYRTPVPEASNSVTMPPVSNSRKCDNTLPPILKPGDNAAVTYTVPVANRLRNKPGLSGGVIGMLNPGSEFYVMDGPVCADNLYWYYINFNGSYGWTAESDEGQYWLEKR